MSSGERLALVAFAAGAAVLTIFGDGDTAKLLALGLQLSFVALAAASLRRATDVPLVGAVALCVVVAGLTGVALDRDEAPAEPVVAEVELAAGEPTSTSTSTSTTVAEGGDPLAHEHTIQTSTEPPTAAQLQRAADLVSRTTSAIGPRYADTEAARAAGFVPLQGAEARYVHWVNLPWMNNENVLDPNEPESLVYRNTPDGQVLEAAMYILPRKGMPIPDVGGSLTSWHNHGDLCFRTSDARIVGTNRSGPCPSGSVNVPTADMLHVWIVDHPGGPFAGIE